MIDINDIRAWHTAIMLIAFIGIFVWAYSKKRRNDFDEAANLPFADQAMHEQSVAQIHQPKEKAS
jgi:cytochrome c oxidase cbb3-type subunit 4